MAARIAMAIGALTLGALIIGNVARIEALERSLRRTNLRLTYIASRATQ